MSKNSKAPATNKNDSKKAPAPVAGRAVDKFGYTLGSGAAKIMAALSHKTAKSVQTLADEVGTTPSRIRAHFAHAANHERNGVAQNYVASQGRNAYVLTGRTLADCVAPAKKAKASKKKDDAKAPAEAAPASA